MTELLALLLLASTSHAESGTPLGIRIRTDTGCPTAAQVAQSLTRLHPDPEARGWTLELSSTASDLVLRLLDPSAVVVGQRRFAQLPDCNLRADAVAATLAVWLSDFPTQPMALANDRATSVTTTPATTPTTATPPSVLTSFAPTSVTTTFRPLRWQLELGAAALGSLDQTGAGAAGVGISAWVHPVARWWGLQAHLAYEAPRSLALGPGFADWQRLSLAAGAHFPLQRGRGGLELEADALAGLAITQGHGLSVSRTDAALDPGLYAGARFSVTPESTWRIWLSVGLAIWPLRQQVGLFSGGTGAPAALATLPQLELLLALGGSWLN